LDNQNTDNMNASKGGNNLELRFYFFQGDFDHLWYVNLGLHKPLFASLNYWDIENYDRIADNYDLDKDMFLYIPKVYR